MNDDEAVTFTEYYDQYRSSVKACLFPWLLAGIILLIFSVIKYSRQVHSKEPPEWMLRIERIFDEGLVILGITLLSMLTFAAYTFASVATYLAAFAIVVTWLKADILRENTRKLAVVFLPMVFIIFLYINYWIHDHFVA